MLLNPPIQYITHVLASYSSLFNKMFNPTCSSKGLGFFTSKAPPLPQLNSCYVTSELNAVRKQRGWVITMRMQQGQCQEWNSQIDRRIAYTHILIIDTQVKYLEEGDTDDTVRVSSFDQGICTYVQVTLCTPEKGRLFPFFFCSLTAR